MSELKIPILSGSYFDLEQFDFTFKDIRIINIESPDFETYIKSIETEECGFTSLTYINKVKKGIVSKYEKYYAIIKIDPFNNFNYLDLINVWRLLLIIYPSDLQIEHIIEYSDIKTENTISTMSSWHKRLTGEYPGEPLYEKGNVDNVNEYIAKVFDNLKAKNYISFAIDNYVQSYEASHYQYQFISLCIALESIMPDQTELTYKLTRNVSIICGENDFSSEIIYNNLKKIYSLRSSIVHGNNKWKMSDIHKYLPTLKAIVSRTIIELLLHNIPTNKELHEKLTKIGFGDRQKLSKNWKSYEFNLLTYVKATSISLD